jgi:hypothetical protein
MEKKMKQILYLFILILFSKNVLSDLITPTSRILNYGAVLILFSLALVALIFLIIFIIKKLRK